METEFVVAWVVGVGMGAVVATIVSWRAGWRRYDRLAVRLEDAQREILAIRRWMSGSETSFNDGDPEPARYPEPMLQRLPEVDVTPSIPAARVVRR